jgi:signal transduction histidine kinase
VNAGDNRAQTAIQALSEESAEDLYEHAPCGYLSMAADGTIVRINQTLCDWLGALGPSRLVGTPFQRLLDIGSRIYYETHLLPLVLMQGFVNGIALDLVRAEGGPLPVLINAQQRTDATGTPLVIRITVFDATDRRRYEHELLMARRQAERVAKDKADLVAMLSHEIRNPLTAFTSLVDVLELDPLTESQRDAIQTMRLAAESLVSQLDHVLMLSKMESGHVVLNQTRFSFRDLVGEVIATLRPAASRKSLELRGTVDDSLPSELIGDRVALRQILLNLVGNAIKFTGHGEVSLRVTTTTRDDHTMTLDIAVADTGIGISREALDHIFEPFIQGSDDTALKFGGTGLGLAITHRLLTLYGSRIRVSSTPGAGSTFAFDLRLPLPSKP